jgi:hypothetical protein
MPGRLDRREQSGSCDRRVCRYARALDFEGVVPAETGRPAYHPSVLLKLYVYGYLNRVQSSRRLEGEAARNVELMWLLSQRNCHSADDLLPVVTPQLAGNV